jgi:hypothetical protein
MSGDDSSVSAATYTSGSLPDVCFTVTGTAPSKRIGFKTDLVWGGGVPGVGDNAKVWAQPFQWIKLTAGWFVEDDLRGTLSTSEFASWLLPNGGGAEDDIFSRFQANLGAHVKIEPLAFLNSKWNGLILAMAFGSSVAPTGSNNGDTRAPRNIIGLDAADVYDAAQFAIGYKLPDIGLARVQFIGGNAKALVADYTRNAYPTGQLLSTGLSRNRDADVIEAAFLFSKIQGLKIDVGAKIPLEYTSTAAFTEYAALYPNPAVEVADGEERIVQRAYAVSGAVSWTPTFLESLNILARVDASFGEQIEEAGHHLLKIGNTINAWFMPSYAINGFVKLGLDLAMEIHKDDQWQQPIGRPRLDRTKGSGYTDLGAGLWCELTLGGGRVRTGALLMLPGSERWAWVQGNSTGYEFRQSFSGEPVFSLPISMTYNF